MVRGRGRQQQVETVAGAAALLNLDPFRAGEIGGGEAFGVREYLFERALGDDLAAVKARAGTHVDDIVGVADRILVMLDDDHRVAKVAEPFQCREQPVVVALMEADAWFVENIEHPRQAAADLAGETEDRKSTRLNSSH